VGEDRARIEGREGTGGDVVVDDGRYLVVRVQRGEGRRELLFLPEVDRDHLVGKPGLLEHDGDLPSVRRGPRVEIDHAPSCPAVLFEDEPEVEGRSNRACRVRKPNRSPTRTRDRPGS